MELGNSEAIRMAVAEGIGVAFVSALVATEAGGHNVADRRHRRSRPNTDPLHGP